MLRMALGILLVSATAAIFSCFRGGDVGPAAIAAKTGADTAAAPLAAPANPNPPDSASPGGGGKAKPPSVSGQAAMTAELGQVPSVNFGAELEEPPKAITGDGQ